MLQTISSKQSVSTISSKGQITLPVAVRRHLGVDINDKVAFMIEPNGKVQVAQAKYPTIASLSGAAGKLKQPLPWKQVLKIAREDRLKEKYG
ncbi:MAG: type II toxin-antitoxin system PrlF family antitoxin [Candidatus Daviesbacteria bacterium]|nr:type II toxin-antitoxin system PrlF family antitoxin [Candidatus Daviesbacteria bacterium]